MGLVLVNLVGRLVVTVEGKLVTFAGNLVTAGGGLVTFLGNLVTAGAELVTIVLEFITLVENMKYNNLTYPQ
ncbi:hypothetical protein [Paucisalibacillus globulus]|uniref:hypothetical protein n=1 Tax=Paucisalibacillus globulus TaxID=351095 RepID=UPI000BB8A3B1|nr:hypothetical protein [Paucisalibacillus globulus]